MVRTKIRHCTVWIREMTSSFSHQFGPDTSGWSNCISHLHHLSFLIFLLFFSQNACSDSLLCSSCTFLLCNSCHYNYVFGRSSFLFCWEHDLPWNHMSKPSHLIKVNHAVFVQVSHSHVLNMQIFTLHVHSIKKGLTVSQCAHRHTQQYASVCLCALVRPQ